MSKENITAVYIRGTAFKAALGSRREQVLLGLKKRDEGFEINAPVLAVGMLVVGFCLGAGLAAMGII